ncbi:hypothetical protein D5F01_LYC22287 [Larimichthys crocea]|uniref:Uncharacterized protein n=1 Tax=Larimichthys crocea TaxID=215358 RepID=A0A6G0HLT1_LARCR|nr:hypothetical protein D5F01_LYC22287 [Larimichthys crocea]
MHSLSAADDLPQETQPRSFMVTVQSQSRLHSATPHKVQLQEYQNKPTTEYNESSDSDIVGNQAVELLELQTADQISDLPEIQLIIRQIMDCSGNWGTLLCWRLVQCKKKSRRKQAKSPCGEGGQLQYNSVCTTEDLLWSSHVDTLVKKAHLRPQKTYQTITMENILRSSINTYFGNTTRRHCVALQRVVWSAECTIR